MIDVELTLEEEKDSRVEDESVLKILRGKDNLGKGLNYCKQ